MIETARLRLRPWQREDRPAFERFNTEAMMRYLGGVHAPARVDAMFERRLADQARDGHCYWAVEHKDSGALVATCGIRIASNYPAEVPVAGMHEIGWRVAEAHWGKGYAREAAEASIAWAWTNLDAPAIGAWTTQLNVPSWRLMERLGMARRPDLDFHHQDHPPGAPLGAMIVYALERPQ
ncbi:GNAT family N-acetyltransferase [Sphingomonas sp. KR3-1]|uniref:GNAT family N-acetyltransferase n=1 Tax=Sphingomonas sp. KR3-1 TaxID=3156611 RepID=UPI0032B4717D